MPLLMLPLHERLGVGREIDLETFILNGMSPSTPSSQGSGNTMEEEADRVQEPEGIEDMKKSGPSNMSKTHRHSQSLKEHALGRHRSVPGLLSIHYSFQFSVYMGLCMNDWVSDCWVFSWALFFFLVWLIHSKVTGFSLSYYILFCYNLVLSLSNLLFLMRDRKRVAPDGGGG